MENLQARTSDNYNSGVFIHKYFHCTITASSGETQHWTENIFLKITPDRVYFFRVKFISDLDCIQSYYSKWLLKALHYTIPAYIVGWLRNK